MAKNIFLEGKEVVNTHEFVGTVPARIFIGLGGVGGRMLSTLHARLYGNEEWKKIKSKSTGFLAVDTNIEDLKDLERLPGVTTFHTARTDRAARLQAIRVEDGFLPRFTSENYVPRTSGKGAGQIRMESRVGYYVYSDLIMEEITQIVNRILDVDNEMLRRDTEVDVFVMGSISGGTGSGCFLPLSYLAREAVQNSGRTPRLHAHLVTSKSLVSIQPALKNYVHANTYAALKELEYLTKLQADGVDPIEFIYRRPNNPSEGPIKVDAPPFDWISIADLPERDLTLNEIEGVVADSLYASQMTVIKQRNEGATDNYTRFLKQLYQNAELKAMGNGSELFTHAYGSQGVAALVCPQESLLDYYRELAKSEIMRFHLTDTHDRGVNLDDFDLTPEQKLKIEAGQWLSSIRQIILDEERQADEKRELLSENGITGDLKSIVKGGIWTRIRDEVIGEKIETQAKQKHSRPKKGESKLQEAPVEPAVAPSVLTQLYQMVESEILQITSDIRLVCKVNPQSQVTSLAHKLHSDITVQRAAKSRAQEDLIQWIRGTDNNPFDRLKLDPQKEKFLVYNLLFSNDPKIRIDRLIKPVSDSDLASLDEAGEKLTASIANLWTEERGLLQLLLKRNKAPKIEQGLLAKAKEIAVELTSSLSNVLINDLRYHVYSALKELLQRRAETYSALSRMTKERTSLIEQSAQSMLSEALEPLETYTLEVEVLEAEENQRLWRQYWDMMVYPTLKKNLIDPKVVGVMVQDIFKAEESRARTQRREVNASRIIDRIQQRLTQHVDGQLKELNLDSQDNGSPFTLVKALEWEALYMINKAKPTAERFDRAQLVEAINSLYDSESDAYDPSLIAQVDMYIRAKIQRLMDKSFSLCTLNSTYVEQGHVVAYRVKYLMASKSVLEGLKRYNETYNLLTKDTQETSSDNEESLDPSAIICFSIDYGVPVYAIKSVEEFHNSYQTIMKLERKPHNLHSQGSWEETLQDLSIQALKIQQQNREDEAIDELVFRCIVHGVIYDADAQGWLLRLTGLGEKKVTMFDDQLVVCAREMIKKVKDEIQIELNDKVVDAISLQKSYLSLKEAVTQLKFAECEIEPGLLSLYQKLQAFLA